VLGRCVLGHWRRRSCSLRRSLLRCVFGCSRRNPLLSVLGISLGSGLDACLEARRLVTRLGTCLGISLGSGLSACLGARHGACLVASSLASAPASASASAAASALASEPGTALASSPRHSLRHLPRHQPRQRPQRLPRSPARRLPRRLVNRLGTCLGISLGSGLGACALVGAPARLRLRQGSSRVRHHCSQGEKRGGVVCVRTIQPRPAVCSSRWRCLRYSTTARGWRCVLERSRHRGCSTRARGYAVRVSAPAPPLFEVGSRLDCVLQALASSTLLDEDSLLHCGLDQLQLSLTPSSPRAPATA
jgi:hypothetical protein